MNAIFKVLGALILYIAIFLYEDEEGRYQNWLEELWIRVRYGRDAALSTAAAIFTFAARATSRMFDGIFGIRLFSFRVVGVSICLSLASFYLFVPLVVSFKLSPPVASGSSHAMLSALYFVSFALLRSIMNSKWESRLWGACLMTVLAVNFGHIGFVVFARMGTHSGFRFVAFLTLVLTLSFACDLCFLGFSRWMIRYASRLVRLPQIVGFLVLNCIVALGIVIIPFDLMLKIAPNPKNPSLLGMASLAVIPLNIIDVLLCAAIFVILGLFVVHRMLWSVLERPLYAAARYGLVKRKSLLWVVGLTLLIGPGNAKSFFLWLVERLSALKG